MARAAETAAVEPIRMGLYDREYYRSDDEGTVPRGDRPLVIQLIVINVALFFVDFFTRSSPGALGGLAEWLALWSDFFREPWKFWTLVSYGFVHDTSGILHVGFNMFFLWLFGRDVEVVYGRRLFLSFYLTVLVAGGLAWLLLHNLLQGGPPIPLVGASGAVTGVMVLFAIHFPHRTFLLFGIVPLPAWVLIGFHVLQDVLGFLNRGAGDNVAYEVHLAGAVFAYLFYRTRWTLADLWPARLKLKVPQLARRPKLRIHEPEDEEQRLSDQVDAILEKISREGESSLSKQERRMLEQASRRYQQKRR